MKPQIKDTSYKAAYKDENKKTYNEKNNSLHIASSNTTGAAGFLSSSAFSISTFQQLRSRILFSGQKA
ncbi:MAG: hypothetical protein IMW89_18420 [Ktedonobacteraceae bacterium]|nr:hypothetical protein [Ktedonobacteraceae bacterium]